MNGESTCTIKGYQKFVVRLPHGMRQRIAVLARLSRRSMNSEIVLRLENSLAQTHPIYAGETTLEEIRSQSPFCKTDYRISNVNDQQKCLIDVILKLPRHRQSALLALLNHEQQ